MYETEEKSYQKSEISTSGSRRLGGARETAFICK